MELDSAPSSALGNSCAAGALACVRSGDIMYIQPSCYTVPQSLTWAVTADGKCINSTTDVSPAKEVSVCWPLMACRTTKQSLPDAIWNLSALGSHSPTPRRQQQQQPYLS